MHSVDFTDGSTAAPNTLIFKLKRWVSFFLKSYVFFDRENEIRFDGIECLSQNHSDKTVVR